MAFNNGLIICYGCINQSTSSGSAISKIVTYPISFSTKVSSVIITSIRKDTRWLYDFYYCYAVFKDVIDCFHIQLHGLNNGQYIDGFTWFAIGF